MDFDKWPRDVHGSLICSPDHPMPADRPSTGLQWAHKDVQLDGDSDEIAYYRCATQRKSF